ncbi:hypothetical protein AV530_019554 [Patagioenas fasciata monilis]|uniref:Uncharacterized protein n=1 Tax=Patagioenas fasciata monilis TaxID=372326 RepID=A0A1V4JEC2_PATFA|nr:hypothetical protein AV530_019554 [Patagioenas fasciata monilis]
MNHSNILLQIPGTPQLGLQITPLSNEIEAMDNFSLVITSARGKRNSLSPSEMVEIIPSTPRLSASYWIKEDIRTPVLLVMSQ